MWTRTIASLRKTGFLLHIIEMKRYQLPFFNYYYTEVESKSKQPYPEQPLPSQFCSFVSRPSFSSSSHLERESLPVKMRKLSSSGFLMCLIHQLNGRIWIPWVDTYQIQALTVDLKWNILKIKISWYIDSMTIFRRWRQSQDLSGKDLNNLFRTINPMSMSAHYHKF